MQRAEAFVLGFNLVISNSRSKSFGSAKIGAENLAT
jgi:hypothetical protein